MKLKDIEILPGAVISVADDLKVGRIKAYVPTLFDTTAGMEKEGLPWIYPFAMSGQQFFSKLVEGSKVWVLKNNAVYGEYWYIPMVEYTTDSQEIIDDYSNAELLISRQAGENSIYVYYNDKDGIMMRVGPNSLINIRNNTEIKLKCGEAYITMKNGQIYIGGDDANEVNEDNSTSPDVSGCQPAVMGGVLENALSELASSLQKIGTTASGNWMTIGISKDLFEASEKLANNIKNIKSNKVKISKD